MAVSGQDGDVVRPALAELVRREVLSVSADPLSPERGSYQFAQNMLRQVAYETLSRHDRKARHLAVAAHLRAAFAGDGEEVTDVIARHYLDALEAVPDAPDAEQIRGQAICALVRAAERAKRTGAPARAATSYATAAELTPLDAPGRAGAPEPRPSGAGQPPDAGTLWERAAESATAGGDWAAAVGHAGRARDYYLQRGQDRAAARAQAIAGRTLRLWGRLAEARDQLTAALTVLRTAPDADTVRALETLAIVEVFVGSADADRLTAEALTLGQNLDVGPGQLSALFNARGIYLITVARLPEAVAYLRESARLSTVTGDSFSHGSALVNLADALLATDPEAAAETARAAAGHLRRAGVRDSLAVAIVNLAVALLKLGEWEAAGQELSQAVDADGLVDDELLACELGRLAALRGETAAAEAMVAGLRDMRASEDPQDRSLINLVAAFICAARGQPGDALRRARAALDLADSIGMMVHDHICWAWPLAARSALELGDAAAVHELLSMLDGHQPGQLAPLLRAERELVRARLAERAGDQAAHVAFATAIGKLRELSTPFHLAHGLLDHAGYLLRAGDTGGSGLAVSEACDIAQRLRCQPLLDRAADLIAEDAQIPAKPR